MSQLWEKVWKWGGPDIVKNFLRLLCHEWLLTNNHGMAKRFTNMDTCPRFRRASEIVIDMV